METFIQLVIAIIGITISIGFFSIIFSYSFSKLPNYLRWIISPFVLFLALFFSKTLFGSFFSFIYELRFMTIEFIHYYFCLILIFPLQFIVIPIAQVFAAAYSVVIIVPKFKQTIGYLAAGLCLIPLTSSYFLIHQQSMTRFMDDELFFFMINSYDYWSNTPFWSGIFIISSIFGSISVFFLLHKKKEPFGSILEQASQKLTN